MSYKVIERFIAKEHGGYVYDIGDHYPMKGKRSSNARIEELSTKKNGYKRPFIKKVGDE